MAGAADPTPARRPLRPGDPDDSGVEPTQQAMAKTEPDGAPASGSTPASRPAQPTSPSDTHARQPLIPLDQLPALPPLRLAVVGHVEVVTFLRVDRIPAPGAICRASEGMDLPAGGGAVVAVQLAKLTGQRVEFFTALGRDRVGEQAAADLEALGLEPRVAWRDAPTRRGVSWVDGHGERTITVLGDRLMPCAEDDLPWPALAHADGVFVTATDAAGLRRARQARVLAATPRVGLAVLRESAVRLDALVGSALDPAEALPDPLPLPTPRHVIATEAGAGSRATPGGAFHAPPLHHPLVDAYGAGDSFAAGLSAALAAQWSLAAAISLGSHCGAACLGGFGPYARQMGALELARGAAP